MLAGRFAANPDLIPPPATTALGALLAHITGGADASTYLPMNVNFGLFPLLNLDGKSKKADRKRLYTTRAREALATWLPSLQPHHPLVPQLEPAD